MQQMIKQWIVLIVVIMSECEQMLTNQDNTDLNDYFQMNQEYINQLIQPSFTNMIQTDINVHKNTNQQQPIQPLNWIHTISQDNTPSRMLVRKDPNTKLADKNKHYINPTSIMMSILSSKENKDVGQVIDDKNRDISELSKDQDSIENNGFNSLSQLISNIPYLDLNNQIKYETHLNQILYDSDQSQLDQNYRFKEVNQTQFNGKQQNMDPDVNKPSDSYKSLVDQQNTPFHQQQQQSILKQKFETKDSSFEGRSIQVQKLKQQQEQLNQRIVINSLQNGPILQKIKEANQEQTPSIDIYNQVGLMDNRSINNGLINGPINTGIAANGPITTDIYA